MTEIPAKSFWEKMNMFLSPELKCAGSQSRVLGDTLSSPSCGLWFPALPHSRGAVGSLEGLCPSCSRDPVLTAEGLRAETTNMSTGKVPLFLRHVTNDQAWAHADHDGTGAASCMSNREVDACTKCGSPVGDIGVGIRYTVAITPSV